MSTKKAPKADDDDVFGTGAQSQLDQATREIAETGGTQYDVGKGKGRGGRGRRKTQLDQATRAKIDAQQNGHANGAQNGAASGGSEDAATDPDDQAEVDRLADEQAADDADHHEQGPPKTETKEPKGREPDLLDNWDPLDDTAISALRPDSRRMLSDGMLDNLARLVQQARKDAKRLGFPYRDDMTNIAKLAGAIGDLSRHTGLDLDAKSSATD